MSVVAVDPAELDSELLLLSNRRHLKNKEPDHYKKIHNPIENNRLPAKGWNENVPNWVGLEHAKYMGSLTDSGTPPVITKASFRGSYLWQLGLKLEGVSGSNGTVDIPYLRPWSLRQYLCYYYIKGNVIQARHKDSSWVCVPLAFVK